MRRPNRVLCSRILPACAVILALVSSTTAGPGDTAEADAKAQFLKFCNLPVAELSKDITPFEERYRNTEDQRTHHVPFFEDSYAIRAMCVAYDMTGDKKYLDACAQWADRVITLQKKMIPQGAYYPNYGGSARQPGQDHGEWWVADCSSIGMGVLAVAVRVEDKEQKARYLKSVRDFADLVIKNYLGKEGGVTDGLWSEFSGEWWCSTAIFGGLMYLLYEESNEPEYLRVATGAMGWVLQHDFHKVEHGTFQESPACVLFYTFEFYAAGLKYLEPGSSRRKTAASQINDALQWLATNQKGRGAKSSLDYLGKDTYMAGMPYLMHAFARQMPEHHDQALAAGQELNYITGLLLKDGPAVTRLRTWESLSWTMMSYAEKLMPGTILRASRPRGP